VAGNSNEVGRSVTSKVVAILETFFHGSIHSLTEIAHHTELPTYPQVRWVGPWGSNPQPVDQKDAASRRLWPLPATTPRLRPHQPHRRTWLTSFHATTMPRQMGPATWFFTLAAPQATVGPTDIIFARIGPG
jgi:hypothetical protein